MPLHGQIHPIVAAEGAFPLRAMELSAHDGGSHVQGWLLAMAGGPFLLWVSVLAAHDDSSSHEPRTRAVVSLRPDPQSLFLQNVKLAVFLPLGRSGHVLHLGPPGPV